MNIIQCTKELIERNPNIIDYIIKNIGHECSLYAYNDKDNIGFIAKKVGKGILITPDNNIYHFNINMSGNLYSIIKNGLTLQVRYDFNEEDTPIYIKDSITGKINLYNHFGNNNSNMICFEQYNEKKNMTCLIGYDYYRNNKHIDLDLLNNRKSMIQINKGTNKLLKSGLVPRNIQIYYKSNIDYQTLNYSLVSFKEQGIFKTIKNGSYNLYEEEYLSRFVKMFYLTNKGNLIERPILINNYLKEEKLLKYLIDNGFMTNIPYEYIDMYNNEDKEINLLQETLPSLKESKKLKYFIK